MARTTEYLRSLALVKGVDRYVVLFEDNESGRAQALRQLGRWACHADLSFSWYDAAVLSQAIRSGAVHRS